MSTLALPKLPPGTRHSVRSIRARTTTVTCDFGSIRPPAELHDEGTMVTVAVDGGLGYAAAAGPAEEVAASLLDAASRWAEVSRRSGLLAGLGVDELLPTAGATLSWQSPDVSTALNLSPWLGWLRGEADAMGMREGIVHHRSELRRQRSHQRVWIDGTLRSEQDLLWTSVNLDATADRHGRTQQRSLGGIYGGFSQQGGDTVLARSGFFGAGARVADEAIELCGAEPCPTGTMDLILMPDQMMLQIHESIGHPLELDRILGDERNFAGGSFVRPEMFGTFQYGSELLDVSYDPAPPEDGGQELVSMAADCWGTAAQRVLLIERGVLKRPLGGALSAARARAAGFDVGAVANHRASSWFRPPIDRMANLNVEPGDQRLDQLVASVENGVLMGTNRSWSIDDQRNSFQFGCEWGRRIVGGRLGGLVRDPNYRGHSARFWRNLAGVGDAETCRTLGLLTCGKGEPNQMVTVGHRSPACLFRDVEVFGAAA